jgi:RimJ/RimL family protein N-acetyltransferase
VEPGPSNREPPTANLGPGRLESARLVLRPLRIEDAPEFVRLLQDDYEAVSMMSHMPWPCTLAAAQAWILMGFHSGARLFAVLGRDHEAFLGAIGYGGNATRPSVGYWLGRPYWNRGYATEALEVVTRYARSQGATSMEAETFPGNRGSERVLEKAGFSRTGRARRYCPARGGMKDVNTWSLELGSPQASPQ